jgi:stage V sporulation protein AD
VEIYDLAAQDVGAGGSGCGCCASVLGAQILPALEKGLWRRVLFAATGALLSPTSSQQGESIPGISHALVFERRD